MVREMQGAAAGLKMEQPEPRNAGGLKKLREAPSWQPRGMWDLRPIPARNHILLITGVNLHEDPEFQSNILTSTLAIPDL